MSEFESEMPETKESESVKKFSPYAAIVTVQAVCVTVIILALLVVKLLFPTLFTDIKKNYKERFLDRTSVSEVLGGETQESGEDVSEV